MVVTCVRNSNAAALGIQIWDLPHTFMRCKSYFLGIFSGDTLSGDTSCCVQRGKRPFAGQIILFMSLNLFFLPRPYNYSSAGTLAVVGRFSIVAQLAPLSQPWFQLVN